MAYIYLISEGRLGPVKVGVSDNPPARCAKLQTGNPRSLMLVAWWELPRAIAFEVERHIKADFARCACASPEWFAANEIDVKEYIDDSVVSIKERRAAG